MRYEKIKYPDGQVGVKLLDLVAPYEIHERINSYEDLFFIKSIVEALNYHNIKNIHLRIPCLFGQRSDRRFASTQSLDLKIILIRMVEYFVQIKFPGKRKKKVFYKLCLKIQN